MNNINNPHDKIFKAAMTDIAVAKSFFENYLPKSIKKHTDWETLRLSSNSYIDKELEEKFSDLLYYVKVHDKESYFYILVEHQSDPDISMAFRLLEYQIKIWRQHLKQSERKNADPLNLPVIYPIVYYTGKRKPYPYSNDLFDCLFDSKSAKHFLFKPFQLVDLTQMPDSKFKKTSLISGLMMVQKHLHIRNSALTLKETVKNGIWLRIFNHDGEYADVLLKYIGEIGDGQEVKEFWNELIYQFPEKGEKIMTYAEQLRKEAKEQVAKKLLELGQPKSLIRKATGISESKLEKIRKTLH